MKWLILEIYSRYGLLMTILITCWILTGMLESLTFMLQWLVGLAKWLTEGF